MKISIAGSHGMIGSAVTPHCIECGYEVVRLVRQAPALGAVWWDSNAGQIDTARLEGFYEVISLASMRWPMRWTEKAKQRMRANSKVTVLVIDPKDSSRWVEVRGQVIQMIRDGAEAHADQLAQRYCPGKQYFYWDIYPTEQKDKETRVIARLQPLKVSLDAIFR